MDFSKYEPVTDWRDGELRVLEGTHWRDPAKKARWRPAERYVAYGRGLAVPHTIDEVLPDGLRVRVRQVDGRPQCVALEVGPPPPFLVDSPFDPPPVRSLNATYLRRQLGAIDRVVGKIVWLHTVRVMRAPGGEVVGFPAGLVTSDADLQTMWDRRTADVRETLVEEGMLPRRGRKPIPAETLAATAAAYREAKGRGVAVIPYIEKELHVHTSTAKKYVSRARRDGFLPKEEENNG